MLMRLLCCLYACVWLWMPQWLAAQVQGATRIDGQVVRWTLTPEGDTLYVYELPDLSVTSPRHFDSYDEYLRYLRYKRYALKVYPYAQEAIRIFREVEYATAHLPRRKQRRYIKRLQRELEVQFEDQLKKLTKTQGYILIKMIERELDTPVYQLIRNLRGTLTATYWSTFSRFWGYRLKEGYRRGEDPILDAVLQDLELEKRR